jgi:cellulose synthase/poly-beta-1,6-N-acetylglucosamine synthase-like glycosyltransferase
MLFLYLLHFVALFFLAFHAIGWVISLLKQRPLVAKSQQERKFALVITAYQNVEITAPLLASLAQQTYRHHEVFLVADCCDALVAQQIASQYQIHLLLPVSPLRSKIKAIKTVVDQLHHSFEAIVIFDPDNLAHPQFLHTINATMNMGFDAVQGQRTAKNLDTTIACLDALGEYYYNVNTRLIPFAIGSSATIAGSGMAITLAIYKQYLNLADVTETPGKVIIAEDKVLQTYLVSIGKTIAYAPKAIVYDEKITTANQLQRQRTRWINTWFKHTSEGIGLLQKMTWHTTWFAMLTFYPPMFMQCIFAMALIGIDLVWFPSLAYVMLAGMVIYVIHFMHSLRIGKAPSKVVFALIALPLFMYKQIISLLQMKKSNRDFMVTEHTKTIRIEDLKF